MSIGKQAENTPITDLQAMLRTIYPDSTLSDDGRFGEETAQAVRRFQRDHSLPVTGIADFETWEAIFREFSRVSVARGQAEPLFIVLQPNQILQLGTNNSHLYLIQGMLTAISKYYEQMPSVRFTGVLDAPTANVVRWLQERADLKVTGEVDKETWRQMAKLYRLTVGDGTGTFPVRISQGS